MKRILFFICLSFFGKLAAQDVVKWTVVYNNELEQIEIKATISDGWHLYSQFVDNSVGPVPTTFTFQSSDQFELKGRVQEPKPIEKYDENFEATLNFFEHEVVFVQKIKVNQATTLHGEVTFMVCNETMCLPPVEQKFSIQVKPNN